MIHTVINLIDPRVILVVTTCTALAGAYALGTITARWLDLGTKPGSRVFLMLFAITLLAFLLLFISL